MRELLGLTEGGYMGPIDAMFMEALQGARVFGHAGAAQEGFSLPQVVIDREKVNYVKAAIEGLEFPDEAGLTRRIVEDTFPETSFLMHETTMAYVRQSAWPRRSARRCRATSGSCCRRRRRSRARRSRRTLFDSLRRSSGKLTGSTAGAAKRYRREATSDVRAVSIHLAGC
jgi:hypothetical protein